MNIVLVAGIATLLLLGVAVGVLDRRDRYGAWRRIARARRGIAERHKDLRRYADELDRREVRLEQRERIVDLHEELESNE